MRSWERFTTEELHEFVEIIIGELSDDFLRKCLEKRLITTATRLINALEKAERLTHELDELDDLIQEDQHTRLIPHESYPSAGAAPNGVHARPDGLQVVRHNQPNYQPTER